MNSLQRFTIRRLLSPSDEDIDLNHAELERAMAFTEMYRIQAGKLFEPTDPPSGKAIRRARPASRGLLLLYLLNPALYQLPPDLVPIGIGLSFPASNSGATIEYVVNRIWRDEEPDYELL